MCYLILFFQEKNQKAPTFAHSKKFVFVTKETRYVSPMQSVVRAEPLITTEQPMVKIVKKPPRLFKAKELILYRNSSSDPSKPPKLQIAPNSTLRPLLQRPQIPSSTIPLVNAIILPNKKLSPLKLKLVSPPEGKNSSPLSPVMISPTNSSNRSDSEQKSPLKLSNLQRIKIISKATGKANLSSTPNTGQKKTLKLSDIHNLKFSSKPYTRTYEPAPEFLRPKKILLKGSLKGINKFLFQNSSFKPLSKQPSKISESSAKQALEQSKKKFMFLGSSNANDIQEPHNQVENESLEDGKQAKLCSQIFIKPNSQSNVLMKSKFSPQTIIKVSPYENNNISKLKDLASSGKSPVIILKPIEKSPPTKDKRSPDTFMRRRATNKILYKCLLCKIIFLTYTTLRLHMFSKHKMTDMSLSRNWEVLGSSGESRTKEEIKECVNVKWIRDSKTLDSKVKKVDVVQDGVRKCVLIQRRPTSSEDESTSSTTDRVGKHANLRKTKKLPGSPYSLSEKRSRVKNVVVRGQRQRSDDKSREEDIQEYKNDLLEIPNVNALKKSDDEFIRLTKLVTTSREKDELEPDDSSLMDNSERLSDGSSTISARDSLCKLSDDSGTLSAPETFAELVKLQAEQSKENNTRRPISRNLKKEKGLTAKQAALISRVTRNRKSENKMSNSRSIVEIKNDKPISSNLKQLKINLKKINVKNQAKVIQSKKESAKALAVERRSQRLRITLQVKKEDEIISTKTNKREKTKKTQIEEISSKIQIRTDIGNKRKPFNRTIVTKNKTKILPSESVETIEKVPLGSKGKKKPQESLEFACSTCSERFARRSELRKHVSTGHKIVKCFVCPKRDCSRKFESRRDMAKHARVHKK